MQSSVLVLVGVHWCVSCNGGLMEQHIVSDLEKLRCKCTKFSKHLMTVMGRK